MHDPPQVRECRAGHDLSKQRPWKDANGHVRCRRCQATYSKKYREKQRAAFALVKALNASGVGIDLATLSLNTDPESTDLAEAAAQLVEKYGDTVN